MSDWHEPKASEWAAERLLDAIAEWLDARKKHDADKRKLESDGVWEIGYAASDTEVIERRARHKAVERLLAVTSGRRDGDADIPAGGWVL